MVHLALGLCLKRGHYSTSTSNCYAPASFACWPCFSLNAAKMSQGSKQGWNWITALNYSFICSDACPDLQPLHQPDLSARTPVLTVGLSGKFMPLLNLSF